MRAFFLVDPNKPGDEYSLTMNTHFLYSPQGLGFEEDNTYRQIGGNFILANTKPKQSIIQGSIHFGGSTPYSRYRDFLAYCARPNIQLAYYTGEASSKETQRIVFKIHAGTGYTETAEGGSTATYPGVLELDSEALGTYYKRYAANAKYEMQTRALDYDDIIYKVDTTFYTTANVSPTKVFTNDDGIVEANLYTLKITGAEENCKVLCNILPYLGNTYDEDADYYTNQVFNLYSGQSEVTITSGQYVKYNGVNYRWNGTQWVLGAPMNGTYMGESNTELSEGSTINPIMIRGTYIVFCVRVDALAGKTLSEWVGSSSDVGLQFYCERAKG